MSNDRTHRERLDALLAGLEDEVLRSEEERTISEAGIEATDVGATRSAIESLIRARLGGRERRQQPSREAAADRQGAKDKVGRAMERLGKWAGVTQAGTAVGAAPRVRMAFFGGGSPKRGKSETSAEKPRGDGRDGGGDVDR